jgi:pimeloyl-ACP methyl ester carboxylesterase
MPFAQAPGAKLYYEEAGSGHPIIFVHEFAADCRHWETQMRWFSRQYRCIAFNARGYTPSEVPKGEEHYGYKFAADDVAAVLDHLKIQTAHVVGLSMGAYAALMFAVRHPGRASAVVAAGVGSGSPRQEREAFRANARVIADRFMGEGMVAMAPDMSKSPTRIQLHNKDARGWAESVRYLAEHSAEGSAATMRWYQGERPSLFDFEAEFAKLTVPTLIAVGDEDEPCIETSLFLKRTIATAGLWMVPRTGHPINLEEPGLFNQVVQDFFGMAERGAWRPRDPRAKGGVGSLTASPATKA